MFYGEKGDSRGSNQSKDQEPKPAFVVKAEGTDIIKRWIEFQDSNPDGDGMPDGIILGGGLSSLLGRTRPSAIKLGDMRLNNGLLEGIGSEVSFDHEHSEFELKTALILKSKPPEEMFQSEEPRGGFSIIDMIRARIEITPEISMDDLEKALGAKKEFTDKYYLTRQKENLDTEETMSITPVDENDPDNEDGIKIHMATNGVSFAYCIHFAAEATEENVEKIDEKYAQLAELTEFFVNAVYEYKDMPTPTKTYTMAPPRNTLSKIERAKEQEKVKRRALSASGLIDGDEDIEKEVEAKILLEERPETTFEDIGGNAIAKEELQTVVDALKNPDRYKKWGTQAPRGVLLFGPPGTGKTLLAKALAHEAEAKIMVVNTADVLHALYGRTERLVQGVFDLAAKHSPVVILFDELDALAGSRDRSTEVTSRIVSVLLQNLQGLEERDQGIIVVGTTNRLDAIDPALIRPGRFDLLVEVDLPEDSERKDIFNIHMKAALNRSEGSELFDSLNLDVLIKETKGFSGADIEEIIRRTLARKVREETKGKEPGPVTTTDLIDTIHKYEKVRQAKKTFGLLSYAQEKSN